MKTEEQTSTYQSPLREGQKAATRQRIIEAAHRLMADRGLSELSFAAVAKEAGVQERTVYRHFPNKDALLDAFWAWINPSLGVPAAPVSEAELIESLPRVYAGFDKHEHIMRASRVSPLGSELRKRTNKERQAVFRNVVAPAAEGLPKRETEWLTAAVQLLYSGAAWQTMKDYWGYSGEEAGKACAYAIELLFEAARKRASTAQSKPKKAKG
jgi:AcrR family transcriptional regulator